MKQLNRRNVLEILGSDKRRYHTCLMTAFTFDFLFFERRVLPVLRGTGVKNINVFVDKKELASSVEMAGPKSFAGHHAYSLIDVASKGVFHPKIMLLIGKSEGMLVVGSGNLTGSGLSSNDEIWSAFHFKDVAHPHAVLFAQAWSYISRWFSNARGVHQKKLSWIKRDAPWISELRDSSEAVEMGDVRYSFVQNGATDNHWNALSHFSFKADKMTLMAPYYDQDGKTIKALMNLFQPNSTACIVDESTGKPPLKFGVEKDNIAFYRWHDCIEREDEFKGRLHAKMIHLINGDEEVLYLGSANITVQALGENHANEEAGILLRRARKKNSWLEELGIHTNESIKEFKQNKFDFESNKVSATLRATDVLDDLQVKGQQVQIFTSESIDIDSCQLEYLDDSGKIEQLAIHRENDTNFYSTLDIDIRAIKGRLVNKSGQPLSRWKPIHDTKELLRTNTDKNLEKYADIKDGVLLRNEEFTNLIQLLNPAELINEKASSHSGGNSITPARKSSVDSKEYGLNVSENSLGSATDDLDYSNLNTAEYVIEVLRAASKLYDPNDDVEESAEAQLSIEEGTDDEGGSSSESKSKRGRISISEKEKKTAVALFKQITKHFEGANTALFKHKTLQVDIEVNVYSDKSLNYLLACSLFIQRRLKNFLKDSDGSPYFSNGNLSSDVDCIKGFLFKTVDSFLLGGGKEIPHLSMKSRHDLLQSILTISLNAFWSKHDTWALKLLILNTIQTLSDKQLNEAILLTFINDSSLSSNIDGDEFSKNKIQLMSILSEWAEWKVQADNARLRSALIVPFKKLKAGEIIFNSKMGFFLVQKVNYGSKSFLLDRGKTELFRVGNLPLYFTHYSPNIVIYR
jgi:hypothetical protein